MIPGAGIPTFLAIGRSKKRGNAMLSDGAFGLATPFAVLQTMYIVYFNPLFETSIYFLM